MSIYDAIELKVTSVDLLTTLDGKSKTSSKKSRSDYYRISALKNADSITEAMFKKSVLGYVTAYGVRPNSEF